MNCFDLIVDIISSQRLADTHVRLLGILVCFVHMLVRFWVAHIDLLQNGGLRALGSKMGRCEGVARASFVLLVASTHRRVHRGWQILTKRLAPRVMSRFFGESRSRRSGDAIA